jgi:hypothetical protein
MWSVVGAALCRLSYEWLSPVPWGRVFLLTSLGSAFALAVWRFGFSRIVRKNIDRIERHPDKVCVFAFQAWKSYLLIGVMIALGIVLRRAPIPRRYLSVVYTTIGEAMLLSSYHYYKKLWENRGV